MCGPIILRIWVKKSWRTFELPKREISLFVQNLYILLEKAMEVPLQDMNQRQISDLITILQAHAKAIKIYSIKEYDCFEHILTILNFSGKRISTSSSDEDETTQIQIYSLLILAQKIIFRSINSNESENLKALLKTPENQRGGVSLILSIYKTLATSIFDQHSQTQIHISYSQLKLASLSTRILNQVTANSFETIASLDSETKLELFLNLQIMFKISALSFDQIKS